MNLTKEKIFKNQIKNALFTLNETLINNRLTIYDIDEYKRYLIEIFEIYDKSEFYAVSIPDINYFWKGSELESLLELKMKLFLENGGKITRIFILKENDLNNNLVIKILNHQIKLNINVYVINESKIPFKLRSLIFIEKNKLIAAKAPLIANKEIEILITKNEDDLNSIFENFKQIMNIDGIQKYTAINIKNNDTLNQLIENTKKNISINKTEIAINNLIEYFKDTDKQFLNNIILLSARFYKINTQHNSNTVSNDQYLIELSKINAAILDTIDLI